jgi:16S rRNA (guanine1207-N2)-methyltransferase
VTGDHYFTAQPKAAHRPTEVEVDVAGLSVRLAAAAGVFSAGRLDPGTTVLLRKAVLPGPDAAGPLLDLGCGYGPIACVLALSASAATVYAVDVNERARQLTQANARSVGVADRVIVAAPDEVDAAVSFGEIWSNPPIRIGKEDLHVLLDTWLPRLAPDGTAWLVVGRHLGADSLATWLGERGWAVHRHASQRGFRVLRLRWPETQATGEVSRRQNT